MNDDIKCITTFTIRSERTQKFCTSLISGKITPDRQGDLEYGTARCGRSWSLLSCCCCCLEWRGDAAELAVAAVEEEVVDVDNKTMFSDEWDEDKGVETGGEGAGDDGGGIDTGRCNTT